MSFKDFSTTHNAPAKTKPKKNDLNAPIVDRPPAPLSKTQKEKFTGTKP